MIGFFPQIYPDELVYSWLARYYARSGYSAYIDAIRDLFGKIVRPDVELFNKFDEDALAVITSQVSMHDLIMKHTMYPYYARFLPMERRKRAYKAMSNLEPTGHNLLPFPQNRGDSQGERRVRYCPLCVAEDRKKYGETYIHRMHQMVGINICPLHHCMLKNSDILIAGKVSPKLHVIDQMVEDESVELCDDEKNVSLAKYVFRVFEADIEMNNPVQAGDFIHSKMANTKYRSQRGQQRNISILMQDYYDFYGGIDYGIIYDWQMQKLLNNKKYLTIEVCQVAMVLGIKPEELVSMNLPKKSQEQEFDELVKKLHKQGISYPKIAEQLGASLNLVKPAGEGKFKKTRRKVCKGGVQANDWDAYDLEILPDVEKAAKEIYEGADDGRPRRVNVAAVEKRLGLTEGRLKKLRRCLDVIRSYSETQEHYWAREVVWVAKVIANKGELINWKTISTMTNMRRENLIACFSDLQQIDTTVFRKVKDLMRGY